MSTGVVELEMKLVVVVVVMAFVCVNFVKRITMMTVMKMVHTMETPLSNNKLIDNSLICCINSLVFMIY